MMPHVIETIERQMTEPSYLKHFFHRIVVRFIRETLNAILFNAIADLKMNNCHDQALVLKYQAEAVLDQLRSPETQRTISRIESIIDRAPDPERTQMFVSIMAAHRLLWTTLLDGEGAFLESCMETIYSLRRSLRRFDPC